MEDFDRDRDAVLERARHGGVGAVLPVDLLGPGWPPSPTLLLEGLLALLEAEDPHGLRGSALANLASAQLIMGDIGAATQTYREQARVGQAQGHAISAVTSTAPSRRIAATPASLSCLAQ